MSTDQEHARKIAERIARSVSANASATKMQTPVNNLSAELSSVRASLSDLQEKLARIEARLGAQSSDYVDTSIHTDRNEPQRSAPGSYSPWLGSMSALAHPSQEKFGVEEATVSELVDFFEKEKTCSLEPGGKPCDHCEMCSSRGF